MSRTVPMSNLANQISAFIASFDSSKPSRAALDMARLAFVDLLGVMLAGGREEVVDVVAGLSRSAVDADAGVLLGRLGRRSASDAALINGTAAHVLDYDDVAFGAHPSAVLVPAILAEAERRRASGLDALHAYLIGFETWGELASRDRDSYHDKGWHPTGVIGPVSATAALCHLRRFEPDRCTHALSIAASLSGGVLANFGSMVKPFHAGRAASAAIMAVDLAARGMLASDDALDGKGGLLAALSPCGRIDVSRQAFAAHVPYALAAPLTFKKYPVCFAAHRVIDALLGLVGEHDVDEQDVGCVEISMRATQAGILSESSPQTVAQAKFSVEFAAACCMLRRRVGLMDLTAPFVQDPRTRAAMTKVKKSIVPSVGDGRPGNDFATLVMKDGRRLESGPIDSVAPAGDPFIKFADCCAFASIDDSRRLYDVISNLDRLDDMTQITRCTRDALGSRWFADERDCLVETR